MIDLKKNSETTQVSLFGLVKLFGQDTPVFAHNPDGDDTALAVVPLSFMEKIAKNTKHAPVHVIKDELIRELESVKTMAEYYELLATELAFNKTLEMLANYTNYNSSESIY